MESGRVGVGEGSEFLILVGPVGTPFFVSRSLIPDP
jgi:hypothetical protein